MQPQNKPISIEKTMFKNIMSGRWGDVEEEYGGNQKQTAQMARITKSDDTVLHLAVTNGNDDILKRLVDRVENARVLLMENKKGNTPLHCAAALGSVSMCKCIIEKHSILATQSKDQKNKEEKQGSEERKGKTLVSARNNNNEIQATEQKGEGPILAGKNNGQTSPSEKTSNKVLELNSVPIIHTETPLGVQKGQGDKGKGPILAGKNNGQTSPSEKTSNKVLELNSVPIIHTETPLGVQKGQGDKGKGPISEPLNSGKAPRKGEDAKGPISEPLNSGKAPGKGEDAKGEELISARNKKGETPLFVAALRGFKDAFIYLLENYKGDARTLCRRTDGDTVLHAAISGEFFDLAFFILQKIPDLANSFNQKGHTPLHALAYHPSAFRSGSQLAIYEKIIYLCTWVDPLSEDTNSRVQPSKKERKLLFRLPHNYETCLNIFEILRRMLGNLERRVLNSKKTAQQPKLQEIITTGEGKQGEGPADKRNHSSAASAHGATSREHISNYFPNNYAPLFENIKFTIRVLLIVLGIGIGRAEWVKEQKQKHVWALQVMEELIKKASIYEYEDTGGNPAQQGDLQDKDRSNLQHLPNEDDEEAVKEEATQGGTPNINTSTTFKGRQALFHQASIVSPGRDSTNNQLSTNKKEIEEEMQLSLSDNMGNSELVEKLVKISPIVLHYNKGDDKKKVSSTVERDTKQYKDTKDTAVLVAAKMGIVEMVKKILEAFPIAFQDTNEDEKNIVHLAVENRQPLVYKYLIEKKIITQTVFQEVDNEDNTALHLAATLSLNRPWLIPGAAMQMQWEIKWFKFVQSSMPPNFFTGFNKEGKTHRDIFTETHTDLVKEGGTWLNSTAQSCSLVAALIATVAFATSATVPGGPNQTTGRPLLEKQPPFNLFAISSLVALCSSVTSLVVFLSILTSRFEAKDFYIDLPLKLIAGLSSLFLSIAAILVSFCAGHFFVLKEELRYAAYPVYAITCFPVTLFALAQLPLYIDLIRCTTKKVPQRTYNSQSI